MSDERLITDIGSTEDAKTTETPIMVVDRLGNISSSQMAGIRALPIGYELVGSRVPTNPETSRTVDALATPANDRPATIVCNTVHQPPNGTIVQRLLAISSSLVVKQDPMLRLLIL